MADQALPNDILQEIFLQLPAIRFILRRVQKLNSYWNLWAIKALRSFEIHPRDNYKLKLKDVANGLGNCNLVFPNITELSISPLTRAFNQIIAKFPKLEKLILKSYASERYSRTDDIHMGQIPPYIKQLIIQEERNEELTDDERRRDLLARFAQLEEFTAVGPQLLEFLPSSLKRLAIVPDYGDWNTGSLNLTKFTALEVLRTGSYQPTTSYLQMKSTTLRELVMKYQGEDLQLHLYSQKNFPNLKRLDMKCDLPINHMAEFTGMEIVDAPITRLQYDERFLKNNPNLIRLRIGNERHVSDLNLMKNLKELFIERDVISPTIMKKVLTIPTLEKLKLSGAFREDNEIAVKYEPNYGIKELNVVATTGTSIFFRLWAHLFRGLVKANIKDVSLEDPGLYSTHLKEWTRLEKLKFHVAQSVKVWYFPALPKLRKFNVNVLVDESIFSTLAQCPNLEVALGFTLDAGPTSSFLVENLIYGFLKAAKSLYDLRFDTKTPFRLVRERVELFVMPEASIYILYTNKRMRQDKILYSRAANRL